MKKLAMTILAVALLAAGPALATPSIEFSPGGSTSGGWNYDGAGTLSFDQHIAVDSGMASNVDALVGASVFVPTLTVGEGPVGSYQVKPLGSSVLTVRSEDYSTVYLKATQALTGQGGWPLNVWLTPDRKPFYGGTYFPARDGDRGAATGFFTILEKINTIYHTQHQKVVQSSQALTEAVHKNLSPGSGTGIPGIEMLEQAAGLYKARFDPINGGVKGAPKFPSSLPVRFLLRYYRKCKTLITILTTLAFSV